jgi:hypothetical protein
VWYFILKYKAEDIGAPDASGEYKLSNVYQGLLPKITGGVILAVCAFLFFYRLGYYDIWEDENLVINAAKGIYDQGFSYLKDGYDRAWLHTAMITGVFKVMGISEFAGRLPSAIFGVVFVLACFYVFARWYGMTALALLIPITCLMNDRFLILFRYMRMYAVLIPLFLIGAYLIHRVIKSFQVTSDGSLLFLPLLAHIHKLSMILLPAFGLFILIQALIQRTKSQLRLLYIVSAAVVVMLILTFPLQFEPLRMFRQVANRIFSPPTPMPAYFEYMLGNAFPMNSTLMVLIAGLGLIASRISYPIRALLIFNYLLISIALVSMVYLITAEGRDYRYIAHLVPFVVCTVLLSMTYIGKAIRKETYPWVMILVFVISSLDLMQDYGRVYVKHPWAPRYSEVYKTLTDHFKPGDALFAQNVKTYYLDPVALAGDHYYKISKRSDYSREQFVKDVREAGHGWVMWELHKSHHWSEDILKYIYTHFKPYHNQNLDDLGVALFYFDETMILQD